MSKDRETTAEKPISQPEYSTEALIERWIKAFNDHNVEELTGLYANNAQLYDAGMRHKRTGQTAIKAWFTHRFQQIPAIQYMVIARFWQSDQAAIHWQVQGRTPPLLKQRWTAQPFSISGVSIFHIHKGLIIKQRGYYDHLQMLEYVLPFIKYLPFRH